jgi:hypothetical protein
LTIQPPSPCCFRVLLLFIPQQQKRAVPEEYYALLY